MALTFTPFAELGEACPDFQLPAIDGKTYSLKDFSTGSPLVVMFICNHCPYVQAIEDRLIQLGNDLKKQNIPVVAICSNDAKDHPEDSFENLQKRAKEKNYPFVYLHDATQEVAHKFGAVCTPDYFVYDKNLKLSYRGRLDDSWKDASKVTKRELYEAVQKLSRGEKVSDDQVASMGCSIKWI
ncbi:thioredoxin family protein [Bdellovibrio sp. HCB2-146]|uniref:thioredoxin family protein n=1 Tax=Bdellovibrio sp. HCB2-146 TaxID=3394362 RepID=UPI0039BCAE86